MSAAPSRIRLSDRLLRQAHVTLALRLSVKSLPQRLTINRVCRLAPITEPLLLPSTRRKSGPFAPRTLLRFVTTTGLSATPRGRACSSPSSRCGPRATTAWGFPCSVSFLFHACRRHYPGGSTRMLSLSRPVTAALPKCQMGRLPQRSFSGPAQRSLAFRPARSLDHPW